MKNTKGFTLVELLAVIVILGVITGMSWPVIRRLQEQNTLNKFEYYGKSLIDAAKVYVDSYEEDTFYDEEVFNNLTLTVVPPGVDKANGQCATIPLSDLKAKALAKDYQADNMSCVNEGTFVLVIKKKEKYTYKYFLACGKKEKDEFGKTVTNSPSLILPRDGTHRASDYCKIAKTEIDDKEFSVHIAATT